MVHRTRRAGRLQVGVIGGGIAGISAASKLEEAGAQVTVFEAANRVGGRACSIPAEGLGSVVQDLGAQFVVSHYRRVFELIRQGKLEKDLLPLGSQMMTVREGRLYRTDAADPMSIYRSGLLGSTDTFPSVTAFCALNPITWLNPVGMVCAAAVETGLRTYYAPEARAGRQIVKAYENTVPLLRGLPSDDYSAWARFDDETAAAWLRTHYGERGTSCLAVPPINTLFFQHADEVSKAKFFWMMANLDRGDRWYVMRRGTQSIVDAVAERLHDVRRNTEVTEVVQLADGRVGIGTDRGNVAVDAAIIAVPPPAAKTFLRSPTPLQKRLLSTTKYASTIVTNILTPADWAVPDMLKGAYVVMIPDGERAARGGVAGFSLESAKGKGLGGRELLGVHLMSDFAREIMEKSDDAIARMVTSEIQPYLPGLRPDHSDVLVKRWGKAVPFSPVGRARFLQEFWTEQKAGNGRIVCVGDGTSFATLEGAASSGESGADLVLEKAARGKSRRRTPEAG